MFQGEVSGSGSLLLEGKKFYERIFYQIYIFIEIQIMNGYITVYVDENKQKLLLENQPSKKKIRNLNRIFKENVSQK